MSNQKLLIVLLFLMASSLMAQSDNERYNNAVSAFFEQDYAKAKVLFQNLNGPLQRDAKRYLEIIEMELDDNLIESQIKDNKRFKNSMLPILARYYQRQNDYAMAISIYRTMIEENYLVDYALYFMAKSYEAWGNSKEAVSRYQSIAKLYPAQIYGDASLFELAIREKNVEKRAASLRLLADTTNYNSVKRESIRQLANIYVTQRKPLALEALENELTNVADRQLVLYNSALLQQKSNPQKSMILSQKIIALDDSTLIAEKSLYAYARTLIDLNRDQDALNLLEQYPYEGELVIERGSLLLSLYRRNGNIEATKILAEQLLDNKKVEDRSAKDRSYLYLQKGFALQALGETPMAMSDYTTAIKSNPSSGISFEASYRIGLIYAKRGEDIRALDYFNELYKKPNLSLQEQEALIFAQSITAYGAAQWRKAIELSSQLVEHGHRDTRGPLRLLAAAYSRDGQYLKAADSFAKVAVIDRDMATDALYLSAINYYRSGKYELAIEKFNNLLDTNAEEDGGISALYWLAKSYEMSNQWPKASLSYEKLLAKSLGLSINDPIRSTPDRGEILYAASFAHHRSKNINKDKRSNELQLYYPVLHQQLANDLAEDELSDGNYSEAANLYKQASDNKSSNPSLLYREALALELSGNTSKALDLYVKYINIETDDQAKLMASRRVAKIASTSQLQRLIGGKESLAVSSSVKAPLVLAYAEQAPFYQQDHALRMIAALNPSEIELIELSHINLAKGQLLLTSQRYDEALYVYNSALNMALSPLQYNLAREKRAEIYEALGDYPKAVNELFLISQSFSDDEFLASSALYKAYNLCKRYNYDQQANTIAARLHRLYPLSDASKKIIK